MAQSVLLGAVLIGSAFAGPIGGAYGGFYAALNSVISTEVPDRWKAKDVSHWKNDLATAFGQDMSHSYGLMMSILADVTT